MTRELPANPARATGETGRLLGHKSTPRLAKARGHDTRKQVRMYAELTPPLGGVDDRDGVWAEEIRLELGERLGPAGPYVLDRLWVASRNGVFDGVSLRWLARDAFTSREVVEDALCIAVAENLVTGLLQESIHLGYRGTIDPCWVARRPGARTRIERVATDPFVREALMRRANFACAICDVRPEVDFAAYDGTFAPGSGSSQLQLDHVIPLARGGADSHRNLQVLCRRCNARKGAKA